MYRSSSNDSSGFAFNFIIFIISIVCVVLLYMYISDGYDECFDDCMNEGQDSRTACEAHCHELWMDY